MGSVICRSCGLEQPLDSFRPIVKGGRPYRRHECRTCERAVSLAHAHAHAEQRRDYSRAYGKAHRAERTAYQRRRIAEKGYTVRTEAQIARRRETERLRDAARTDEQRRADADKWREYFRDYHGAKRARVRGGAVEPIDAMAVIERDGSACYLCGKQLTPGTGDLTFDHVIPLSRGGSHSQDNLRVACRRCNSKKRNLLPDELAS